MPSRDRAVSRYVRQFNERKKAKKRRKLVMLPIKLVFSVVLIAVIAYFAIQIFLALNAPMTTATALPAKVYDEISIVGYFVRQETVLEEEYNGILVYSVSEGKKVSKFGEYAAVYTDSQAANLKSTIAKLNERIVFLSSAVNTSTDTNSIKNLSSLIYDGLFNTAELVDFEAYSRMSDYVNDLKSNIIKRELTNTSVSDIKKLIQDLENQRDNYMSLIGSSETILKTPQSGFFSSHVDGFETVFDITKRASLTPSYFQSLVNQNITPDNQQVGKIVTSFKWYFISNMRKDEAYLLTKGGYTELRFDAMGDETVRVRVESVSAEEDGLVTVVFTSDKYMEELVNLRKQSAGILLATYEGLKVPSDAVRVDGDGNLGVYVITGMYSEFKKINVLYKTEDYYIVETDPRTTKSLLIFDFIIVNGKGLSNGKVIK